ncbi:MAG: hypothetical protein NC127_06755 [Muribaculum sp.]|nr:hypothetical protein [Muribaculum sp.]
MKRIIYITFLLLSNIYLNVWSQIIIPSNYSDLLSKADIQLNFPENFHLLDIPNDSSVELEINPEYVPKYAYPGRNIGWAYPVGVESDNNDAVFLYPIVFPNIIKMGHLVEDELQAYYSDSDLDISNLVKTIPGGELSQYTNADTIYVYELDLKIPFRDKYVHAVGVCLRKINHGSLMLKMILTDKGIENKETYFKTLLKSLSYGDNPSEAGIEEEQNIKNNGQYFMKPAEKWIWVKPKEGYIN